MSSKLAITILSALLLFSLLPSFDLPYMVDDYDLLRELNISQNPSQFLMSFFAPHNEHIMPLVRTIYYVFYRFFWLNTIPFHILIWLVYLLLIFFIHKLLYGITGSYTASLTGAFLFGFSNMYLSTLTLIPFSHTIFCLFFIVFLCYSVFRYAETEKAGWLVISFFSTLCAGFTLVYGSFSFFIALLFFFLCIPKDTKKSLKKSVYALTPSFAAFVLVAIAYAAFTQNDTLIINKINVAKISLFVSKAIFSCLIPGVLNNRIISQFLFIAFLIFLVKSYKFFRWKASLFFIFLIVVICGATYIARSDFGEARILSWKRYYLLPLFGLTSLYALVLDAFLKSSKVRLKKSIINILFFFLIILGCITVLQRFDFTNNFVLHTKISFYFCRDFRNCITDYRDTEKSDVLNLKNKSIYFPAYIYPSPKPLSFYAEFILPKKWLGYIAWGSRTDRSFINFLKENKDKYKAFYYMFLIESD